jgi:hypothetical protein
LPSLDFLRGFEAAGRRLSLRWPRGTVRRSRHRGGNRALEDALGAALFEGGTAHFALTPAGAATAKATIAR